MFSKTFYILLIFSLQFSSIEEKVSQNSNLKHKTCAFSTPYHSRTPTTLLSILLFEGQTGHSCATLRVIPSNQTFLLRKTADRPADSGPKKRHSKTRKRTLYYIMSVVEFKLRQQRYGISLHVQNFSRTFA